MRQQLCSDEYDRVSMLRGDTIRVTAIHTSSRQVIVEGIAKTRNDVVLLKKTFEQVAIGEEPCFSNVDVPEADLVTARDASFSVEMILSEACMRPQPESESQSQSQQESEQ